MNRRKWHRGHGHGAHGASVQPPALVFRPINELKYTGHRFGDLFGGFGPAEWRRLLVVSLQVATDRPLQGNDGTMAATSQPVFGQAGEETLHQVDPGTVGRREMAMEPGVTEQPLFDLRGLVGAVVVEDQVGPKIGGDDPVDAPQEADEVDAAVAALDLADDPLPVATSRAANSVVVP